MNHPNTLFKQNNINIQQNSLHNTATLGDCMELLYLTHLQEAEQLRFLQ